MNKKAKPLLIFVILIILSVAIFIAYKYCKSNNYTNNNSIENDLSSSSTISTSSSSNSNDNNKPLIAEKIYFEGKEYASLSDVPEEDLNNHFKLLVNVLVGKTYDTFTDEDISIVVAHYLLNIYTSATDEQVKAFVKEYFNIDNYELKTGTYPFYVNGQSYPITITKEGNIYKSDLGGRGYPNPWNRYDYKDVKDNQIIMTHNYAYFDWTGTKVVELVGITKLYLESNGSSLYVKRIEYISK